MTVKIQQDGPITTVLIDRPEVMNAVDRPTAQALADAFRAFEADPSARVAVLGGTGGTFCAGADLRAIANGAPNRLEPSGDAPMGPSRMVLSKPVIAAISGFAVAGGLELACWADLRVVEADATLGVLQTGRVPLIDGGTVRLPRIIGLGRALDLILTGREVSAEEALRIGLADRVVPTGQGLSAAHMLAAQIASFRLRRCWPTGQSTYAGLGRDLQEALVAEFERGLGAVAQGVEGARRFIE